MKKLLAILLVILMISTVLAACGTKEDDLKGSYGNNDKTEEKDDKDDDDNKDDNKDADEENDDILALPGEIGATVYTNEFANLKVTLPEDWTFSSEEDIMALMNLGEEMLSDDEKYAAELGKQATIYSMMAQSADSMSNVILMFENLAKTGGLLYDEKDYADVLSSQLEALEEMNYTIGEATEKTVAGIDFLSVSAEIESSGIITEQCYLIKKLSNYMMCISITTVPEYSVSIEDILPMFSAAK